MESGWQWLAGYTPYGRGTLSVTVLTGLNCNGNSHNPGEPEKKERKKKRITKNTCVISN